MIYRGKIALSSLFFERICRKQLSCTSAYPSATNRWWARPTSFCSTAPAAVRMATAPPAAPKKKLRDTPSEKFSITRVPSEWLPKGLKISKAASGEWVVGAWGFPHMTVKEMKASGYCVG